MIKQRLLISVLVCATALSPLSAGAQIFGPSDEEKAREAAQDQGIKDLQNTTQQQDARIRSLEDKVQGLTDALSHVTGTNEELSHQIQQQNDKIDRMQKDFAYRLCQLSAQQLGAGDSMNCAAAGTPSAGQVAPQSYSQGGLTPGQSLPPINATGNGQPGFVPPPAADNGAVPRGRAPGILGTLPMGSGPAGGMGNNGGAAPGNSAQYDQAMNLMRRAQYDEASAAFRAYADANPDDTSLSPQAIYWVANIAFIRQDYATSARTFAEVIKKYPKSQPASEAMLKLAQSFMSMGQKSEGCTTLGLIKSKYPDASPQILSQAANLRKTACR
ncbi:MAG TPA: tol-pal system protein YbgF [Rhizomicrobium sp.]|nr:tol-pal system protein YbgF [Rhizomicrobium sp.]